MCCAVRTCLTSWYHCCTKYWRLEPILVSEDDVIITALVNDQHLLDCYYSFTSPSSFPPSTLHFCINELYMYMYMYLPPLSLSLSFLPPSTPPPPPPPPPSSSRSAPSWYIHHATAQRRKKLRRSSQQTLHPEDPLPRHPQVQWLPRRPPLLSETATGEHGVCRSLSSRPSPILTVKAENIGNSFRPHTITMCTTGKA